MTDTGDLPLQAAFFSLPAPAAILDEQFRFVAVSDSFLSQFEYQAREVLGQSAQFLYDATLHEVELNSQLLISSTNNPRFDVQRTIRTRSGRALDATVCIAGLPESSGRQYVVLYQNLADGHQKEHLLLSRAEMFRLMVERSPLPISVQDSDWRLILVNQAYCELTGYQKSELLGRDPADFMYLPEQITDLPAQRKAILNLNVDEFPHHQVIREFIRRDGTAVRYSGLLGFTRGPSGEPLWCATLIDLTSLDKLRAELHQQTELADVMQGRFDRFSSLSGDGIAIVERDQNRIVHANKAMSDLFALDQTQLVGAPFCLLMEMVRPEDTPKIDELLAAASSARPAEVTVRLRQDVVDERWIRMRTVSGERHRPEYLLVFEDITEQIERQEERAREAAAQIETIVSEVHHRIKNHLQGVLSLLRQRDDADPMTNAMIAKAATQIAGIAEVHGILMKSPNAATLTNMVTAIANATARLWYVEVDVRAIDDGTVPIHAVEESESVPLALIVNELVLNAVKHRRGLAPISVQIRQSAQTVVVNVSNTGLLPPGFDFDAVARTSGLGLVRSLLARSGASLSISAVGDRVVAELTLSAPVIFIVSQDTGARLLRPTAQSKPPGP